MKNTRKLFGFAVIAAIALNALLITGCDNGGGDPYIPPENKPVADRWGKWVDDTSTATLVYSVDDNGVCKITVDGTAQPNTDEWGIWKANAQYDYTATAGKSYTYIFQAWTESGARELYFQYCTDNDEEIYLGERILLTNERQTYTVNGGFLSKGAENRVEFQCANQTGTFYVKILEIKEYNLGKLTITNFSGSPGLTQNNYLDGWAEVVYKVYDDDYNSYEGVVLQFSNISNNSWYDENGIQVVVPIQIKGNTLTIPVWEMNYEEDTFAPFTGNITVAAGDLRLWEYGDDEENSYSNKAPITFTNGNATINFRTQMEFGWSYGSDW